MPWQGPCGYFGQVTPQNQSHQAQPRSIPFCYGCSYKMATRLKHGAWSKQDCAGSTCCPGKACTLHDSEDVSQAPGVHRTAPMRLLSGACLPCVSSFSCRNGIQHVSWFTITSVRHLLSHRHDRTPLGLKMHDQLTQALGQPTLKQNMNGLSLKMSYQSWLSGWLLSMGTVLPVLAAA